MGKVELHSEHICDVIYCFLWLLSALVYFSLIVQLLCFCAVTVLYLNFINNVQAFARLSG